MEQLGRYQVIAEVGRGGMGIVYHAIDPLLQRPVALKTVRLLEFEDVQERRNLRDRLLREARAAGILSHPGIVMIYQIEEDNGVAYIAMEFVQGRTLGQLLSVDRTPKRKHVFNILQQVANALDYAHSKGVIHRDIKPGNVMIQQGGVVKITDFGIAKATASVRTQTGIQVGTPFYMSPEQILGHAVDGRTDQYSLAIVAYQMLTGERPFSGDTLPTLIYRILREEPQPDNSLIAKLGEPIEAALRRAMSKQPDARYASCSEFVNSLSEAALYHSV
jgi:serine/threonine-protein kinase